MDKLNLLIKEFEDKHPEYFLKKGKKIGDYVMQETRTQLKGESHIVGQWLTSFHHSTPKALIPDLKEFMTKNYGVKYPESL